MEPIFFQKMPMNKLGSWWRHYHVSATMVLHFAKKGGYVVLQVILDVRQD
jgi:hypothetical protein